LHIKDFAVSLDYPNWRFVTYANVSDNVSNIEPITNVFGGAAAVLSQELYMARYSGPTQPGEVTT